MCCRKQLIERETCLFSLVDLKGSNVRKRQTEVKAGWPFFCAVSKSFRTPKYEGLQVRSGNGAGWKDPWFMKLVPGQLFKYYAVAELMKNLPQAGARKPYKGIYWKAQDHFKNWLEQQKWESYNWQLDCPCAVIFLWNIVMDKKIWIKMCVCGGGRVWTCWFPMFHLFHLHGCNETIWNVWPRLLNLCSTCVHVVTHYLNKAKQVIIRFKYSHNSVQIKPAKHNSIFQWFPLTQWFPNCGSGSGIETASPFQAGAKN